MVQIFNMPAFICSRQIFVVKLFRLTKFVVSVLLNAGQKLSELLRDYYVKTQTPVAVVAVSTNERLIGPVHTTECTCTSGIFKI